MNLYYRNTFFDSTFFQSLTNKPEHFSKTSNFLKNRKFSKNWNLTGSSSSDQKLVLGPLLSGLAPN